MTKSAHLLVPARRFAFAVVYPSGCSESELDTFALVRGASVSEDHERVAAIWALGKWVGRALRQLERADRVAREYHAFGVREQAVLEGSVTHEEDPEVFIDSMAAAERVSDEIYFLLLAAHHALVVGPSRVGSHISLPKPRSRIVVEKLRDVYEHWEQVSDLAIVIGEDDVDMKPWARKKSGKFLAENFPYALPYSYSFSDEGLRTIAGVLDIGDLRADLHDMGEALGDLDG